jgi:Rap1a immunity proteins
MGATARIILLTLSVGLASGAKAEPDLNTANDLLPACKAYLEQHPKGGAPLDIDQGYCVGLIYGIAYMMKDSSHADCSHIPDGATVGQVTRVVIHYIEERPNRLHEPFRQLAAEALANAWPCREAKVAPSPGR